MFYFSKTVLIWQYFFEEFHLVFLKFVPNYLTQQSLASLHGHNSDSQKVGRIWTLKLNKRVAFQRSFVKNKYLER